MMSNSWHNKTTIAQRLRVRGSGLDPTSTRLRVANLLQTVDMHPDGLAPSAILCVRTLRDPLPGKLQLRGGSHAMQPPADWKRAVVSSLNQLARDAVHPAREAVPANAEAVLFADHAEALACLASDWCHGVVSMRWWWQSLFSSFDLVQGIVPLWQARPTYIPAALQHLAERGEALHFVRRLEADDAYTLIQALTEAFALPALYSALNSRIAVEALPEDQHTRTALQPGSTEELPVTSLAGESTATVVQPAPWHSWVPEATEAGLHWEQQSLLGLGLMLRRAPMHVRTSAFVDAVQQWHSQSPTSSPLRPPSLAGQTGSAFRHQSKTAMPSAFDSESRIPAHAPDAPQRLEAVETETQQETLLTTAISSKASTDAESAALADERATLEQGEELSVPVDAAIATADEASLQEEYVETSYGGIFYLLNLAIALDLYGDFTQPLTPGIPLNIWDFIALLGLSLLGEPLCHDPAWWLLAHLATHDTQEPPGKDYMPPGVWRVPREWLSAFTEQTGWRWWVERERLCVYHSAGFIVLDLPLVHHNLQEQLAQEMRGYEGYDLALAGEEKFVTQSLGDYPVSKVLPRIERWLNWLMPYVRARLCRALGLTSVDDLSSLLCRHRASVRVTATHLDIFLSLQELPIAIRLAGLDRDPGWIPAAGRFVAFHFR